MIKRYALITMVLVIMAPAIVSAGPQTTLKLSHHAPLAHAMQTWAEDLAQEVDKQSGGKLEIEVFGAGQLGGLLANTEGVSYGTIDISIVDLGTISTMYARAGIMSVPFLWKDFDAVESFYDSQLGQQLREGILKETKIRVLYNSHSGFRVIISDKPVANAADMKLMKIRVPEIPLYVNTMKAIGANPTPIPWGEVYTSLQTGVVNAAEAPSSAIWTTKLHEVTKYVARTNHIFTDVCLVINDGVYQKLGKDLQAALEKAAQISGARHRKLVRGEDQEYFDKLTGYGLQAPGVDVASFQGKVAPVWDEFIKKADAGDLIKAISNK